MPFRVPMYGERLAGPAAEVDVNFDSWRHSAVLDVVEQHARAEKVMDELPAAGRTQRAACEMGVLCQTSSV